MINGSAASTQCAGATGATRKAQMIERRGFDGTSVPERSTDLRRLDQLEMRPIRALFVQNGKSGRSADRNELGMSYQVRHHRSRIHDQTMGMIFGVALRGGFPVFTIVVL